MAQYANNSSASVSERAPITVAADGSPRYPSQRRVVDASPRRRAAGPAGFRLRRGNRRPSTITAELSPHAFAHVLFLADDLRAPVRLSEFGHSISLYIARDASSREILSR